MEQIFEIIYDPGFQRTMHSIGIVALIFAVGIVVIAFSFYGRSKETSANLDDERWVLLFASWRDSMIITLLFTAEGFIYRFNDFTSISEIGAGGIFTFGPIVTPVAVLVIEILIFMVAVMRVITISRWIASRT